MSEIFPIDATAFARAIAAFQRRSVCATRYHRYGLHLCVTERVMFGIASLLQMQCRESSGGAHLPFSGAAKGQITVGWAMRSLGNTVVEFGFPHTGQYTLMACSGPVGPEKPILPPDTTIQGKRWGMMMTVAGDGHTHTLDSLFKMEEVRGHLDGIRRHGHALAITLPKAVVDPLAVCPGRTVLETSLLGGGKDE